MNNLTNARLLKRLLANILLMFMCIGIAALTSGCASNPTINPDYLITMKDPVSSQPKSIFVFLDGTANDESSATNVWRLFDKLKQYKNKQTFGRYIEGVGSVKEPDWPIPIVGDALGLGMQPRILEGYDFIAQKYKPGDEIFIFGFSRGAHEARALAGLIAYAGVPKVTGNNDKCIEKRILKIVQGTRDKDYTDKWKAWKPNQAPLLANEIKKDINVEMQAAEIKFLGVWDTVPGSAFKDYENKDNPKQHPCKENIGCLKKYFHWIPGIIKGERYKSGSYPPIRHIAHAVASDEKRSKFAPLLLCPPIENSTPQTLDEKWFPGAHADVGGGYDNCNKLPAISLNWMIDLLAKNYSFNTNIENVKVPADLLDVAHWSYGDEPGNIGSDCKDRGDLQPQLKDTPDPSIEKRKLAGSVPGGVPIKIKGVVDRQNWKYPIQCPGPGK